MWVPEEKGRRRQEIHATRSSEGQGGRKPETQVTWEKDWMLPPPMCSFYLILLPLSGKVAVAAVPVAHVPGG